LSVRWSRTAVVPAVLIAFVVIGMVAGLVPGVAGAQQEQRQLDKARARLAALAAEIETAEAEAGDADRALEDADAKLREIEAVVNDVAEQVARQHEAVADAQLRLDAVEAEAADLADAFADRITRLFKQGPSLAIEVLLGADNAEDALARTAMLQYVMEGDQIDLERLDAAEVAVTAERERLAEQQRVLEQMLAEQQELLEEVARLRETRALAAAQAREEVRLLHGQQDDLEAEQERLEDLIKQKQEEERQRRAEQKRRQERERQRAQQAQTQQPTSSATTSAPSSSGYAWPLCARVTSEYGPRWGRMHRGIDLGASTGTAIGASKAGTVIFAGWQGGYGRLLLIDHGDGVVTAYAHMSQINVSSGSVSQGQTIGLVGSTGNSTGPHLHFETRVNGSAVNPRQYLSGSPC
jgi:murein DD-endopeptidase MepM/ murein hydrolase activator NlpD